MIKLDISKALPFVSPGLKESLLPALQHAKNQLDERSGEGNEFLGWLDLPQYNKTDEFKKIKADAFSLIQNSDFLVVVGIGGSYLGARAVIEALAHSFMLLMPDKKSCRVIYAGHTLSSDYHHELLEMLDRFDYSLCVISKSGTTTEPAIAFRLLKNHIEKKYGNEETKNRIIAITDKKNGALKSVADTENYRTYVIPDDVGGRFSVLSPVGLLPIAAAGFDIELLLKGAADMQLHYNSTKNPEENLVLQYALIRNLLYQSGKPVELLANYLPRLTFFSEWWKQLYGESEGKDHKGIFPAAVSFTTDLHSMGQYIQDGLRIIFETVLTVYESKNNLTVPIADSDADGLGFLAGASLDHINNMACKGTSIAHFDGGVPLINITVPQLNEYYIGQLIYFFELACALSGYMLKVNPFNQPGVEDYKRNMFILLNKPGYESYAADLNKRMNS